MKLDRVAVNSIRGVALLLLIFACLGDFLAPNPPGRQDLRNFYAPPTRIHFVDTTGKFHVRPFVYRVRVDECPGGFL